MAWIRLAYKEFSLPFYYWKKEGCPGGRDFVWLTILITMILTFTLLSWGSYKSLLNRFVDILIGKVEGHGVPVLVIANPFTRGGVNLIDSDVLGKTEEQGYKIHPYREVGTSYVELLERDIWKIGDPGFNGWAVYADNPLLKGEISNKESLPLEIVMNRSLFRNYFDYALYREELKKIMPLDVWKELPENLPGTDEPIEELWLRIRSGNTNEPLPFRIIWVDYIPTLEKVAFLFPLSTYHALSFANRYELNYFPEGSGNMSERIKEVLIKGDINMEYLKIEAIKKALRGDASPFRGNTRIAFRAPVTKMRMDFYAEKHNLEYEVLETMQGDRILHDQKGSKRSIWLPVKRLPYNLVTKGREKLCTDGDNCFLPLDVTMRGNGFSKAQIYISDRTTLSADVERILKVHDKAFLLTPVYQDALNRFGFLNRMVESMRQPYVVIFGFFLFALLAIHISTIVGHRRHRYGMLLSKGVNWSKLYMMLFLQILMAICIGMTVSAGIIRKADIYLRNSIASVAADYTETLNVSDFTLLQLSYADYIVVVLGVLILSLIFCTVSLFYMPLRPNTHPSLLFKE